MEPFISVRRYIKWEDEPETENTNTLVLTSRSQHFVDIRVFLPCPSSPNTPNDQRLPNDPTDASAIARLEWAFAGTSSSTHAELSPTGATLKPAHTIWNHWIDSHPSSGAVDEGDMFPQPDGTVLEYGSMMHPVKKKVERYVECCEGLEVVTVGAEDEKLSWVLTVDDKEKGVKGIIIRIGGVVQGLLVHPKHGPIVQRWEWEGEWKRTLAIGALDGLYELLGNATEIEEGLEIDVAGLIWKCVESYRWR